MAKKKSVLRKTLPLLKLVSELPLSERKSVLKKANGNPLIYQSMREIAHNIINGNVKLNKNKLKKSDLSYLKEISRKENNTKNCNCKKRSRLIQRGAGLLSLVI